MAAIENSPSSPAKLSDASPFTFLHASFFPRTTTRTHSTLASTLTSQKQANTHHHLRSSSSSLTNTCDVMAVQMNRRNCFLLGVTSLLLHAAMAGNFYQDFDITWGEGRAKILDNGELLALSLDQSSGSGVQSKNQYLFGKIDVQIKLVPGNSAGTVTAYYMSSQGASHDEIDMEFLGNLSGDPYTLHTNLFAQGKGNREMQFKLWFDPTADFHTYSILWNPRHVLFMVDGTPIREFKNMESRGIAFPNSQPMRIYSSLWDADDWATQGGRVKTDWANSPFKAFLRNFNAEACVVPAAGVSSCPSPATSESSWYDEDLDASGQQQMSWVQNNYMIYNYCTDYRRFPHGFPPECSLS